MNDRTANPDDRARYCTDIVNDQDRAAFQLVPRDLPALDGGVSTDAGDARAE